MELLQVDQEMVSMLEDISNEDLLAFAKLQDDPESNTLVEYVIYTYYLLFKRTKATEHLQQALRQATRWQADIPDANADGERCLEILKTMIVEWIMAEDPVLGDANIVNLLQ